MLAKRNGQLQYILCFLLIFTNLIKNKHAVSMYMESFILFFFSVMTYWRIQTVKSIPDQNL